MDELEEIRQKEEKLYDDVIEPKDKLRYRHPLFMFLAVIALLAILFFALDYFISAYIPWRKKMLERKKQQNISFLINEKSPPTILYSITEGADLVSNQRS